MYKKVWDTSDDNLPLVVKDTSWRFIHDFFNFTSCKGVFIFSNTAHKVKYVGHTNENCVVEAIAEAIANGQDNNATLVKVLYTQIDNDAELLFNVFIEKYKPVNNFREPALEEKIITGTNRPF
jgi:hypothetical protein